MARMGEAMGLNVLVAGGAGYIGSHACKALRQAGHMPVVYDDMRRGNRWSVRWGPLVEAPLEDAARLRTALSQYRIDVVMHFAAYAYVEESTRAPSLYFRNNVATTLNVLDAMRDTGVRNLVLSSTCAVYGQPERLPITEATPTAPMNAYGESKRMMESVARWYAEAHGLRFVSLRYFNAAGADPDGEIGEAHDPEPHLLPNVIEAALDPGRTINVMGTDYPTRDGTAVRDYVHVADLADAHLAAMNYLWNGGAPAVLNLGSGRGTSVAEVVQAVAQAAGRLPRVAFGPRRAGDPAELVADPSLARETLGWRTIRSDIEEIARDAVRWHREGLPACLGAANLTARAG